MTSVSIHGDTADQAGEARRRAASLAAGLRLDETAAGRLALVVTECANNLWKHGGGGEILLNALEPDASGVDVLARWFELGARHRAAEALEAVAGSLPAAAERVFAGASALPSTASRGACSRYTNCVGPAKLLPADSTASATCNSSASRSERNSGQFAVRT